MTVSSNSLVNIIISDVCALCNTRCGNKVKRLHEILRNNPSPHFNRTNFYEGVLVAN